MTSIKAFLMNAKKPIGKTMYIYGGGWNKEDVSAGNEAMSIGLSELWEQFANKQTYKYNFKDYYYCNNLGLDCSGYVGWIIYNTFQNLYSTNGYVYKSTDVGYNLVKLNLGIINDKIIDYRAGDILCSKCNCCKHVWISIGQCSDDSVLLFHSSPPGVMLSGTTTPDNKKSEAIELAQYYMKKYYKQWYNRFPEIKRDSTYLTHYRQFRWHNDILPDTENYKNMSVENVLKDLFSA